MMSGFRYRIIDLSFLSLIVVAWKCCVISGSRNGLNNFSLTLVVAGRKYGVVFILAIVSTVIALYLVITEVFCYVLSSLTVDASCSGLYD